MDFFNYEKSKLVSNEIKFIFITLLVSFVIYWTFIGTTVVEARFGYPLYFFALPFAGLGVVLNIGV